MQIEEIRKKYFNFKAHRDSNYIDSVWRVENEDFRKFWDDVIMNDSAEIDQNELMEIIQIFDCNASRGGKESRKYEFPVARAIIYQTMWEGAFRKLKADKFAKNIFDQILKSADNERSIQKINELTEKVSIAGLTGRKGVMLNCILAGYDAFGYLSMVSLEHRFQCMNGLGINYHGNISDLSYGEKIIFSNDDIVRFFKEQIDENVNARLISEFLYAFREMWDSEINTQREQNPEESINLSGEPALAGDYGQNFGLESQLENFLIENWNSISEFKDLELISDVDGEIISQQYRVEIGRIDILARDKSSKDYVIIELKKNRATEWVVGQIRKYLGWIKKNLAYKEGVGVRGVIIVPTGSPDLEYAVMGQDDIKVFTYKINFELNKICDK